MQPVSITTIITLVLTIALATASQADPNAAHRPGTMTSVAGWSSWSSWRTLDDGHHRGIDYMYRSSYDDGKWEFQYKVRSRYKKRVDVSIRFEIVNRGQRRWGQADMFSIRPGATKRSYFFTESSRFRAQITRLRFPDGRE